MPAIRIVLASLLIAAVATGCLATSQDPDDDAVADEGAENVDSQSEAVGGCPDGWHPHVATWNVTLREKPCGAAVFTIPQGANVCMQSAPATSCNGQGYSKVQYFVFAPGWARTEAFNGH